MRLDPIYTVWDSKPKKKNRSIRDDTTRLANRNTMTGKEQMLREKKPSQTGISGS